MLRRPEYGEIDAIARLWHEVWHAAHGPIVPISLVHARTLEEFRIRVPRHLADMRLAGPVEAPVGLCIVSGAELEQIFVARIAQGTGLADALIADAEARIRAGGATQGWLTCAQRNDRAARFYERHGWTRTRTEIAEVALASGRHPLAVWRYEKDLGPARA